MVAATRATLALPTVARWNGWILSCKGTIPSQNRVFQKAPSGLRRRGRGAIPRRSRGRLAPVGPRGYAQAQTGSLDTEREKPCSAIADSIPGTQSRLISSCPWAPSAVPRRASRACSGYAAGRLIDEVTPQSCREMSAPTATAESGPLS